MWNKFTPHELNIIFTNGPIEMLDRAWKKLDRGDVKYLMTSNLENGTLIEWDPFLLKDEKKRIYHNYFPSLVEMKSGEFRVIAFKPPLHNRKQDPGRWFAMPSLNFLPIGINKVIAGDGGLLVCDGAMQWTAMLQENGQLPPIATRPPLIMGGQIVPMDPTNWTKKSYLPGQTILLVWVRDVALAFPFHPQGYEKNEVQCPIVLQPFGVKSPEIIVVLSRKPFMANTMAIFQVEMSHDYGTGYEGGKPNLIPETIINPVDLTPN
ncbi:unnamed protein product [Sphagnum compactum]